MNSDNAPPLSSVRPARGRYRNFPPTEPEIHRGGFVPLPRAQGGFVPIVDPRLEEKFNNRSNNGTSVSGKEKESHIVHERKVLKSSNYTVAKVERTSAPFNHTAPKNTRQRHQGHATSGSAKRPSTFVHKRFKDPTSTSTTTKSSSSEEPGDVIVVTEVQESQNSEIASKIVWTTPRTTTTTTATRKSTTTTKEPVTDGVETVPSKRMTNSALREVTIRTTELTPLEIITTENSADFLHEMPMDQHQVRPILPTPTPTDPTSTATRNLEASALSALLVPGGQVPQIPVAGSNTRPLGKPTITKVPSPYVDPNEDKLLKEDSHHSGSSVDEAVKLIDDGDFNWYFQHYNDSNLEPYVGVVYGGSLTSSASLATCRIPVVMTMMISFWYLYQV